MIHIFVVFHKRIFDDCYKNIPQHILDEYFTFVAVNPKILKTYTRNKYRVINEWELPIYDPTFQERGYNENSVLYHVYANKLHEKYTHVGFFQYDMVFNNNIVEIVQANINEQPQMYFPFQAHTFDFCAYDTWNEALTLEYIIADYEKFFGKTFNRRGEYPLYNSYVLPVDTYSKVMSWVEKLYEKMYPWCIRSPNMTHFGHVGGIYERVMAFAIGQEGLSFKHIDIKHDNSYKKLSY